jgi:hypothetical protein
MEYFYYNHCGIVETSSAVVVGNKPAIQNPATEMIVNENGSVTYPIREGDNAHLVRAAIIDNRDRGIIHNHWIITIPGDGLTITFTDPATMPPPYDKGWAEMHTDWNGRLTK